MCMYNYMKYDIFAKKRQMIAGLDGAYFFPA